jgi:hypothetical protein
MSTLGTPHSPNPPTASEEPSTIPLTASAALTTTLSTTLLSGWFGEGVKLPQGLSRGSFGVVFAESRRADIIRTRTPRRAFAFAETLWQNVIRRSVPETSKMSHDIFDFTGRKRAILSASRYADRSERLPI